MASTSEPGVAFTDVETHRDVHIVRVTSPLAQGASLYYALTSDTLLFAFDKGTLARQLDARAEGHGVSTSILGGTEQFSFDAGMLKHSALWWALAWRLEYDAQRASRSSRQVAQLLCDGAPAEKNAIDTLARNYFGARPVAADGGSYACGAAGAADATYGSAPQSRHPELPVPGSPIAKLLDVLAGVHATLAFDEDPVSHRPDSLHASVTLRDWRNQPLEAQARPVDPRAAALEQLGVEEVAIERALRGSSPNDPHVGATIKLAEKLAADWSHVPQDRACAKTATAAAQRVAALLRIVLTDKDQSRGPVGAELETRWFQLKRARADCGIKLPLDSGNDGGNDNGE